jgi:hypothetical protein
LFLIPDEQIIIKMEQKISKKYSSESERERVNQAESLFTIIYIFHSFTAGLFAQ